MRRTLYEWQIRDRKLQLGERTLIMGILNVTPDSFSDGGLYYEPDLAYARALELEEQGADIIDIGAESTRPGSPRILEAEELRRLIPVLKRLKDKLTIPVSVDTYKSTVAAKAIEHGAAIINDPSGLTFDPELAKAAMLGDAGLILNHMRGMPDTWAKLAPLPNAIAAVYTELEAAVHRAQRAGANSRSIVIDPGFGFGKRGAQNYEILAQLQQLQRLNLPLLVGPSRKSFLRQVTEELTSHASSSAIAIAALKGAHLVRVHDVVQAKAALSVVDPVIDIETRLAEAEAEQAAIQANARAETQRRERFQREQSPRDEGPPRWNRGPRDEGPQKHDRRSREEGPPRQDRGPRDEGRPPREYSPRREYSSSRESPPERGQGPPRREYPTRPAFRRREDKPGSQDPRDGPPRRDSPFRRDPPNRRNDPTRNPIRPRDPNDPPR